MRIEGVSNTSATASTNIADLLGRLDTGDVIKAKVLDITPSEILLRLFDGSVLKAAKTDIVEAKIGQTLTLSITSMSEGTLFLETVKDLSRSNHIKPEILKNMLESFHIKADAKNIELAFEFMKAGIPATTTHMNNASALLESFKGLNAEKAVFIASKSLQTDQINFELLAKLLDGDIKLGEQLKGLQFLLDNHLNQFTAVLQNSSINTLNQDDSSVPDLSKLMDTIKELFIHINLDKSASELDVNKLHKDLNMKLDILKAAIQASELTGLAGGESITAATALLDDSAKLLNHLNNNNMLYYQMPVNLSGHTTTAELYIMKRRQSQKKIDPHNTVMFVSLDTNNIGRIETLLNVKGNRVSINLRTEKQQINEFVKENIKYLYSGLADCGYKLVDIKYALINSATTPMKQEQLLLKMMDLNHSKVDMRI